MLRTQTLARRARSSLKHSRLGSEASSVGCSTTWILGVALSLDACTRGRLAVCGSWGSGSTSMSSKLASLVSGENGSTGSSTASNRVRLFLVETVDASAGGCKPFLDLAAPMPLVAVRICKTQDGLFRNSFALGPSCQQSAS
jgi:hypothetical protein